MANGSRIDRSRLLRDREYLLQVACGEFQKVDTYHRGLITASNFSKALAGIGLEYGQPEVDDILQFCTVTDDGYVHYKELCAILAPQQPRAKQSTMKNTIYPAEAKAPERAAPAEERNGFFVARTDDIRKVYSLWERGRISNEQFKDGLQSAGAPVTEELERLLVMYGPARALPFSKLMYALQVDANDGRRARNVLGVHPPVGGGPSAGSATGARSELRFHAPSSAASLCDELANPASLRQAICDFVDGHIPAVTFRSQLQRFGMTLTPELDKMIRTHESDSSVRFQDFARLLLRQDKEPREALWPPSASGSATPVSHYRSGVTTPRSDSRIFARDSSPAGSVPYASGGSWAEAQRFAEAPRAPAAPVQPPYATEAEAQAPSPAVPSRPRSQPRVQGHGDILGWNNPPLQEERGASRRRVAKAKASFLQWPPAAPEAPEASGDRPGRRLYGQNLAASESAPFGRSCDVGRAAVALDRPALPFGTDQDLGHRRPEDAGTDEYRATGGLRRR